MGIIIDFKTRKQRVGLTAIEEYVVHLNSLEQVMLLEEMVEFNKLRIADKVLTDEEHLKGIALFRTLVERAETEELRNLAGTMFNTLTIQYTKPVA